MKCNVLVNELIHTSVDLLESAKLLVTRRLESFNSTSDILTSALTADNPRNCRLDLTALGGLSLAASDSGVTDTDVVTASDDTDDNVSLLTQSFDDTGGLQANALKPSPWSEDNCLTQLRTASFHSCRIPCDAAANTTLERSVYNVKHAQKRNNVWSSKYVKLCQLNLKTRCRLESMIVKHMCSVSLRDRKSSEKLKKVA